MDKKQKLQAIYATLSRYKYHIVIAIGVLIVVFIDENSLVKRLQLRYQIEDLKSEIKQYNTIYENDKKRLHDLDRNPKNIRKIARERYFMKADDEDIYVLSTDKHVEDEYEATE